MRLWNRLVAPAAPRDGKELTEALQHACYGRIVPLIRQFSDESDLEQSLALVAASNFGEMARQSCREVSGVVFKTVQEIRRQAERCNGGRPLPSCSVTRNDILTALAPCLSSFGRALDRYSREHELFNRVLAEAQGGFVQRSFEAGYHGAALGNRLAGPLGAVVGGLLNGFCVGKATENVVEAGAERFDHAFQEMLGAWDEAMAALSDTALEIIEHYADQVSAGGA
jgi:hypothetical protein